MTAANRIAHAEQSRRLLFSFDLPGGQFHSHLAAAKQLQKNAYTLAARNTSIEDGLITGKGTGLNDHGFTLLQTDELLTAGFIDTVHALADDLDKALGNESRFAAKGDETASTGNPLQGGAAGLIEIHVDKKVSRKIRFHLSGPGINHMNADTRAIGFDDLDIELIPEEFFLQWFGA